MTSQNHEDMISHIFGLIKVLFIHTDLYLVM